MSIVTTKLLLDSRDIDGAWVCPQFLNPWHEITLLDQLDRDRLCPPAEEMEGEVREPVIKRNAGGAAGPSLTQVLWQDTYNDEERC